MSKPLDLAEIRARLERTGYSPWKDDTFALLDEVERLHSWPGLLSLMDEHWPEGTFPTLADDPARDTGPRLLAALRRADRLASTVERVRELVADTGNTSTGPTYALCADVLAAIEGTDS